MFSSLRFDLLFASYIFFFFNDTATTEIYTLSLHDALPICSYEFLGQRNVLLAGKTKAVDEAARFELGFFDPFANLDRSEEHTSELQSHVNLVCRLLLEKKNRTLQ